jgi:predicted acyl esterase
MLTCGTVAAPAAPAETGDIPAKFEPVKTIYDFDKREVMIPMRDGVRLFTIIVIPKGATQAPMILDRTPYSAAKFVSRVQSPHMALALPTAYGELAEAGYIVELHHESAPVGTLQPKPCRSRHRCL